MTPYLDRSPYLKNVVLALKVIFKVVGETESFFSNFLFHEICSQEFPAFRTVTVMYLKRVTTTVSSSG